MPVIDGLKEIAEKYSFVCKKDEDLSRRCAYGTGGKADGQVG